MGSEFVTPVPEHVMGSVVPNPACIMDLLVPNPGRVRGLELVSPNPACVTGSMMPVPVHGSGLFVTNSVNTMGLWLHRHSQMSNFPCWLVVACDDTECLKKLFAHVKTLT